MADSIAKICKDIEKARGEICSPTESSLLDICERLARRIASQQATLTRKLESLDRATANARTMTARF